MQRLDFSKVGVSLLMLDCIFKSAIKEGCRSICLGDIILKAESIWVTLQKSDNMLLTASYLTQS